MVKLGFPFLFLVESVHPPRVHRPSPARHRLVTRLGWQRLLPASGNGANIVQVSSLAPPPQPNRRPRSWLLHFIAPATPALWQRDGIGSLHLRFQAFTLRCAPVHFFRLRFRSPMPEERRTKERRERLSEPFPPAPSRHPMREREQAACLRSVLPHSSASSSPARPAPVRITPFYCQPSVTAKRSSHRVRCVGHGSCRVACVRYCQNHRRRIR